MESTSVHIIEPFAYQQINESDQIHPVAKLKIMTIIYAIINLRVTSDLKTQP